jgi:ABC-type dipeptide/oligopeptide/nickel transport system permease component
MNKKLKPFMIVGIFWLALFFFVIVGYSSGIGLTPITGFAVSEGNKEIAVEALGVQSIAILILFFTNIVTMFFLVREIVKK